MARRAAALPGVTGTKNFKEIDPELLYTTSTYDDAGCCIKTHLPILRLLLNKYLHLDLADVKK